jgi:hypothetical protein
VAIRQGKYFILLTKFFQAKSAWSGKALPPGPNGVIFDVMAARSVCEVCLATYTVLGLEFLSRTRLK